MDKVIFLDVDGVLNIYSESYRTNKAILDNNNVLSKCFRLGAKTDLVYFSIYRYTTYPAKGFTDKLSRFLSFFRKYC